MSFSPIQLKEFAGGPVVFDGLASGGGGGSQPFASVQNSGTAIVSGATVPLDTVIADAGGFLDAPNNQFVIPVGLGGIYLVGAVVVTGASGGNFGTMFGYIETSGAALNVYFPAAPGVTGSLSYDAAAAAAMRLDAGDALSFALTWDGVPVSPSVFTPTGLWLQRMGDAP